MMPNYYVDDLSDAIYHDSQARREDILRDSPKRYATSGISRPVRLGGRRVALPPGLPHLFWVAVLPPPYHGEYITGVHLPCALSFAWDSIRPAG